MRHAKRTLSVALAALVLFGASGCSYSYYFDLTLTVVNAADGTPVPDAKVTPEFSHSVRGEPSTATGPDGRYTRSFGVSITAFDDHRRGEKWLVMVERDGFTPQVIDIKPANKPAKYGSTTPLNVTVRLEPEKAP